MVILRRALPITDPEDGVPIRRTLGPHSSVWDTTFPVNVDGVDHRELQEGFFVTEIAPERFDSDEHTITREEYYRVRGGSWKDSEPNSETWGQIRREAEALGLDGFAE